MKTIVREKLRQNVRRERGNTKVIGEETMHTRPGLRTDSYWYMKTRGYIRIPHKPRRCPPAPIAPDMPSTEVFRQ